MTKLYPNDPYSGDETEEKKARITIWKPLLEITIWDDAIGIAAYLITMIAIGWIGGILVWGAVS